MPGSVYEELDSLARDVVGEECYVATEVGKFGAIRWVRFGR